MIKVTKRDCTEVDFDKKKIYNAILKAMPYGNGVKENIAEKIADEIEAELAKEQSVEIYKIEELVFDKLIKYKQRNTAKAYEGYRQVREYQRYVQNSTDNDVLTLLVGDNEYLNDENSNKNAVLQTTVRDYMAGIMSKDLTKRYFLSPNIVQAHDDGLIHFHDMDYFAQYITNCCLINLKDMLENGTCINGITIDPQKRITTAMTVATQIITAVASSQYGGTTINLSHLAPFVRGSENEIREKYNQFFIFKLFPKIREKLVQYDLHKEIKDAVQTFNYQINSMATTNGQSPFISVFMYLNDDVEYTKEVALLIEEFFNQRIKGMKNRVGIEVTQAFPKLLYVLDENNITEDSEYWWLTKLGAKCTAKRLVPDYISAKKMKELKNGDVFGCIETCA